MIPSPTKPILSGTLVSLGVDGAPVPLYRALQRILRQREAAPLAIQAQACEGGRVPFHLLSPLLLRPP